MSEEGGGKIKSKRGSSQSKPYERRKSLLGKVTDTLKEVIAPSWLSDLVSSVRKTSPKKEDEEKPQQNVMGPMPSQVMRKPEYQRDGLAVQQKFVPLSTNSNGIPRLSHKSLDPLQTSKLPFTAVPEDNPSCAWLTPQQQNTSITDNQPENSSTKGMVNCDRPKLHHMPEQSTDRGLGGPKPKDTVNEEVTVNCNHDQTMDASTDINRLEKSVTWSERFSSKKGTSLRSKAGFDVSLFSSPLTNNFHSKSFHESMFYPGKTSFGGASSHRSQLNMTAPYQTSFPVRQKMKVKPSNSSASAATSSNAKKILETLEKLSTPLSDAKKIPLDDTVLRLNHFSPGSFSRRTSRHSMGSYLDSRRELLVPEKGPPKSKVSMPTAASISKNYQKMTTSFVDKKSESFSQEPPQFVQQGTKSAGPSGGGKVKDKKFSQHIPGRKAVEIDEEPEVPNLRTDFTLSVQEMPKFNFSNDLGLTRSKTVLLNSEETVQKKSDLQFTFSSPIQKTPTKEPSEPKSLKTNFTFSSPLEANSYSAKVKSVTFDVQSDDKKAKISPEKGFQFGSPVSAMTMPASTLGASPVLPSAGTFKPSSELKTGSVMDILSKSSEVGNDSGGFKPAAQLKQGSVMDVLGKSSKDFKPVTESNKDNVKSVFNNNKNDSGSFGSFKPATELKTGSVMDVLVTTSIKSDNGQSGFGNVFKKAAGSWNCDVCLVNNKSEVTKCVACQSNKPSSEKSSSSSTGQKSLSNMFKSDPGSWSCDICLIKNKPNTTVCAACQTKKPGSDSASSPKENSFTTKFKKPEGVWDCDTCLVPNKAEATKCIACATPRPGLQSSSFAGGFKFGTSPSSSFSGQKGFVFGNATSNTDSSEKKTDTTNSLNKTSSDSASGFKFGNISSDDSSKKTDFKFGSTDNSASSFKFGTPSKTEENISKTNNYKFGSTDSSASVASSGFQFGVPTNVTSSTISDITNKPVDIPSVVTNVLDKNTTSSIDVKDSTPKSTGGFQFSTSDKISASSTGEFNGTTTATSGFKFGDTATSTAMPGFKFGVQESSVAKTSPANSAGFGGVNINIKQEATKPFSVAEQPAPFNFQSPTSQKRSLDSDDGPSDAKKAFSFGATNPSNPADNSGLFKMSSTTTTPAAPFNMAQNSTSTSNTSSTETPSAGGFNFSPSAGASVSSGFGSSKPAPAASTGGFSFGAQPSTEKPTASTFNFGGTSTSAPPMFGTNTPSTTPAPAPASTFVFGQAANNQGTAPFSFTAQPSTNQMPTVPFGAPQSTNASSTPAFGAPQSTNASSTPAFGSAGNSFGGASFNPVFGGTTGFGAAPTPAPAASPFGSAGTPAPTFGNAAPATTSSNYTFNSTPSFNFGANATASPASNGPGVFQFGKPAENASQAQPQGGATGGFNFGQTQTVPVAPATGSFNFNASSSNISFGGPPSVPGTFNIGATANSDRKIKRAVRKIRR